MKWENLAWPAWVVTTTLHAIPTSTNISSTCSQWCDRVQIRLVDWIDSKFLSPQLIPVAIFQLLFPCHPQGWQAPAVSFFSSPWNDVCIVCLYFHSPSHYLKSLLFGDLVLQQTYLSAFKLNSKQSSKFSIPWDFFRYGSHPYVQQQILRVWWP